MNAAFTQAARNVLFHDESLLQRFRLTVKASPKPQKSKFTFVCVINNQLDESTFIIGALGFFLHF